MKYVLPLNHVGMKDVAVVGGKNASLGEMITQLSKAGVRVPDGFATTASAYQSFLAQGKLTDRIHQKLSTLDVNDLTALAETGDCIRQWIMDTPLESTFEKAVRESYEAMQKNGVDATVAVRSSATAEDLPEASFAGQQETFLNICGIDNVFLAIRKVFASLFTNRAISYRAHQHFNHENVLLSAGVQRMVRSDLASSGVMFTVDTESGFEEVILITSSYGLGEMVVQGAVNPDEFYVHKPTLQAGKRSIVRKILGSKKEKMIFTTDQSAGNSVLKTAVSFDDQSHFSLTDDQILTLAKYALIIEKHYARPMDIEWGLDGVDHTLYILQARPETVASRQKSTVIERYVLGKHSAKSIVTGRSIGQKIGSGVARILKSIDEMNTIKPGDVLVADMTDPDWEPVMKTASAIVTNRGGRTCHAAIIAREMGIPAVVGCGDATACISDGDEITVSCAEGDTGFIYPGKIPFDVEHTDIQKMPEIPLKIAMNIANPDHAFALSYLPNAGVGLARLEFIINSHIGYHPKALLYPEQVDKKLQEKIKKETAAYASPKDFYIEKLTEGIATLAAAFYPKPVIVRLSDFKSNEYANLHGGKPLDPAEENPMLGFRGASRYGSDSFRECFDLECAAIKKVRNIMGLTNVQVMIPFVRTVKEASDVIDALAENDLKRGNDDLKLIMMCEIPSNALLAEQFLSYFDGFSIGSNDMTQLTLGLDRDSAIIANSFDERDDAVKTLLAMAIAACKKQKKYVGICGQGPSDHPDFALWLLKQGIDSISLNPDTIVETWLFLAKR